MLPTSPLPDAWESPGPLDWEEVEKVGAGIRRPEGVGSMVMELSSGTKRQERKPTTITGWEVEDEAGSWAAGDASRVAVAAGAEVVVGALNGDLSMRGAGGPGSRKNTALCGGAWGLAALGGTCATGKLMHRPMGVTGGGLAHLLPSSNRMPADAL